VRARDEAGPQFAQHNRVDDDLIDLLEQRLDAGVPPEKRRIGKFNWPALP
jgi:hypothetical protein